MTQSYKTYKTDGKFSEESLESGSSQRTYSRREKWTCGLLCGAITLSIILGTILTFFIITDGQFLLKSNETELLGNSTKKIEDHKTPNLVINIKKYLDEEVDPCEDFYEFACGNYMKRVALLEPELFITSRNEKMNSILEKILEQLESNSTSKERSKTLRVAKMYYQSCTKEEDDVKFLKDLLDAYGSWPVVKGKNWKSQSYKKLLYMNEGNGISTNFIVDVFVDLDWKDPSRTIIYIDQPSFGMTSRLYLLENFNDTKIQAYLSFQARMAKLLGADNEEDAKNELKKSLLLEIALAKVSQNADERRNKSKLYNPMSLKHLQKITKNASWKEYIERILDLKELSDEEEIIVMSPKYLENIDKILKNSKKRVIANYIIWRTILESTEYLSSPEVTIITSKYMESLYGVSKSSKRNLHCGKLLNKNFPLLTSTLIRRSVGRNDSRTSAAEEIIDYVKIALKESIKEVSWIQTNVTREKAEKKLSTIKYFFTGVQEKIFTLEFLDKYYKKLNFNKSDSFFDKQRKLVRLRKNKISRLQNGESEDYSVLSDIKNDAFNIVYTPEKNIIRIPMSTLDEHEFESDQSKFLSFGTLGTSAGFGLSQALDDIGRQFTEKGVLKLWWDKDSTVEYKKIMECIAKQYKYMFEDNNILISTRKTRGKNWSDLSGVSSAYKAYQIWKEDNPGELSEPTLKYTTNQLFWLSYAQKFCTKASNFTNFASSMIMESDCVPGILRVNGPLQNIGQFSEDWKCSSKSKMNPKNKCSIW